MAEATKTPTIKLQAAKPRAMSEFWLGREQKYLAEAILKGEMPIVDVNFKTKTRVRVSISGGQGQWSFTAPVEGFKTHTETTMSYFDGKYHSTHYFVLSKKQGYGRLLEFIKACAQELLSLIPVDEITLGIEMDRNMLAIKHNYNDGVQVELAEAVAHEN
jgi:hypothetical protein